MLHVDSNLARLLYLFLHLFLFVNLPACQFVTAISKFFPSSDVSFWKFLFSYASLVIITMIQFYQAVSFQDGTWSHHCLHPSGKSVILVCFMLCAWESWCWRYGNMHSDCCLAYRESPWKIFWENLSKWNLGPDVMISIQLPALQHFTSNLQQFYALFTLKSSFCPFYI